MNKVIKCIEERFRNDIKDHSMEILMDNDVYRHVVFSCGGSSIFRFDLITWPGNLCIKSDCGTYVFNRIHDMFGFFGDDDEDLIMDGKLRINPRYWGEKLLSICAQGGYQEYSEEQFVNAVTSDFEEWEFESDDHKDEVWSQIKDEILMLSEYEHGAYSAVNDFKSENGHQFVDFFEHDLHDFTFSYLWCLYAIVFGIRTYDISKQPTVEAGNETQSAQS